MLQTSGFLVVNFRVCKLGSIFRGRSEWCARRQLRDDQPVVNDDATAAALAAFFHEHAALDQLRKRVADGPIRLPHLPRDPRLRRPDRTALVVGPIGQRERDELLIMGERGVPHGGHEAHAHGRAFSIPAVATSRAHAPPPQYREPRAERCPHPAHFTHPHPRTHSDVSAATIAETAPMYRREKPRGSPPNFSFTTTLNAD